MCCKTYENICTYINYNVFLYYKYLKDGGMVDAKVFLNKWLHTDGIKLIINQNGINPIKTPFLQVRILLLPQILLI